MLQGGDGFVLLLSDTDELVPGALAALMSDNALRRKKRRDRWDTWDNVPRVPSVPAFLEKIAKFSLNKPPVASESR